MVLAPSRGFSFANAYARWRGLIHAVQTKIGRRASHQVIVRLEAILTHDFTAIIIRAWPSNPFDVRRAKSITYAREQAGQTFFNFPLDGLLATPYNEGSSKGRAPIKGGKEKHL